MRAFTKGNEADIVVGVRPLASIEHLSVAKRWLQRVGTNALRSLG